MKLKCLQCEHEFEGTVSWDEFGWHSSCPECGGSFDTDEPNKYEVIKTIIECKELKEDDKVFLIEMFLKGWYEVKDLKWLWK